MRVQPSEWYIALEDHPRAPFGIDLCRTCGIPVLVDTDGNGRLVEYDLTRKQVHRHAGPPPKVPSRSKRNNPIPGPARGPLPSSPRAVGTSVGSGEGRG